jgi:hypothetical protein
MARKRGGLAGLYDRNKGVIRMLAPAVVGAIPGLGPLAAAGLGAAMRGLDREGKRGIGFDLGQGIRGGLEGYGAGLAGKSVAGGVKGMLAPKTAIPKVDTATINTDIARGLGAGPTPSIPMPTGAITAPTTTPAATSITARAGEAAGAAAKRESGRLSRATQFLEGRPKTMEAVTKGIQMALPPQESQASMMAAETARNRLAMEREQMEQERQRQMNIAEMLMPMYRQMAQRRGMALPGMASS